MLILKCCLLVLTVKGISLRLVLKLCKESSLGKNTVAIPWMKDVKFFSGGTKNKQHEFGMETTEREESGSKW